MQIVHVYIHLYIHTLYIYTYVHLYYIFMVYVLERCPKFIQSTLSDIVCSEGDYFTSCDLSLVPRSSTPVELFAWSTLLNTEVHHSLQGFHLVVLAQRYQGVICMVDPGSTRATMSPFTVSSSSSSSSSLYSPLPNEELAAFMWREARICWGSLNWGQVLWVPPFNSLWLMVSHVKNDDLIPEGISAWLL